MKFFERRQIMRQPKAQIALPIFLALVLGLGGAQTALAQTPAAGMTQVALIPIHCVNQTVTPNCLHDWTTSGATQASTDIFSFDFATNTMYFADRVNQGITVIDTRNNKYLGTIPVPSCNVAGAIPGSCPSGVQVVHDQRKLIVTDRNTSVSGTTIHLKGIFIYDLKIPNSAPVQLTINTTGTDTDELDYDPVNRRAYVANTACPCVLTVVDVVTDTIVDTIPLPSNPEQPRFNPVDGKIYLTIPDDGTIATGGSADGVYVVDPTKTGAAALSKFISAPTGCAVRGIDIDPVTNTGVIGCAAPAAQFLLDFNTATIPTSFPGVTGTDTLQFNPNLRRWYTGSSNNTVSADSCPALGGVTPVIGVFAAPAKVSKKTLFARLVGADCSGVNAHGLGVDTIANQVYVGARQFPAASGGTPGVLVYEDTSPLVQPKLKESSNIKLEPLASPPTTGRVVIEEGFIIDATVSGVPSGTPTVLVVTTTAGNEVVPCDVSSGNATCFRVLRGQALLGGNIFVSTAGTLQAKATIK